MEINTEKKILENNQAEFTTEIKGNNKPLSIINT